MAGRGIIAGALSGLAGAAGNMAEGYIQDERKLTVAQQLSDMEEQRQQRAAEAAEVRRRSGRQADTDQDLANAPRKNQAEIDRLKTVGPAETEQAAGRAGAVATATGKAQGAAERENAAAYAKDPQARAGARAAAVDKAVFSPSAYAEADLARMKVQDLKAHRQLVDEYAAIDSDTKLSPEEKTAKLASKQKQIELNFSRSGVKKDTPETDTEKVTTTSYGPGGEEIKTEKTQKRKAPPGSGGAAQGGKVATMAEVESYAKARGITVDAAKKGLATAGYKIQ